MAGLMKMFSVSDLSYPLFIPKGSKAISPGSRDASGDARETHHNINPEGVAADVL